MNLYIRELKAHRKSIIIWSLAMILFVVMGMQKYSSFLSTDGSTAEMMKLLNSMPKFLQAMWGVDTMDITTPIGYYGVLVSYLMLMVSIHAATLGTNIIFKEERDKTADFLMSKPISRKQIIHIKYLAGMTNIAILNIITIITSVLVLKGLGASNIFVPLILTSIALLLIQDLFLIIGLSITAIIKHPKKASMITLSILLGTYFLSLIADMTDKLKFLELFTPYKYFDAKDYFVVQDLDHTTIVLVLLLINTLLVFAYNKYNKRDLTI